MRIEDVIATHQQRLMSIPGVVSVGVGERGARPVLLVMLDRPASHAAALPAQIDGFPVAVEVIGEVAAL